MKKNYKCYFSHNSFRYKRQNQNNTEQKTLKILAKLQINWFTDQNDPMHSSWVNTEGSEHIFWLDLILSIMLLQWFQTDTDLLLVLTEWLLITPLMAFIFWILSLKREFLFPCSSTESWSSVCSKLIHQPIP